MLEYGAAKGSADADDDGEKKQCFHSSEKEGTGAQAPAH